MSQSLAGADIRGYYQALGMQLPDWAQREASISCFADPEAHRYGDRNPSCSVNLEHGAWHCHGCGATGGAYDAAKARGYTPRAAIDLMVRHGLVERRSGHAAARRRILTPTGAATVPQAQAARPKLAVTESDARHWQLALTEQTALIARLARERAWLYSTMWELGVGYDCGRITIPVRERDGRLVGLLRYRPWPKPGQPKMLATAGSRRALLPHPSTERSRELLLVEGEPDMIAARSRGLPAIALPGVDAWRPEWAHLFTDRDVTIVMDADPEGRRAAERIAHDLRGHADATVLDLAPERNDGYDLTDWFLDGVTEAGGHTTTRLSAPSGHTDGSMAYAYPDDTSNAMTTDSPTLLTPEEAAAIARCSVKTVRRAYSSGALLAYRRRGSRAVLLDPKDVHAWVQGQIVRPTVPTVRTVQSMAAEPSARRSARRADHAARAPRLGSQLRFDLSAEGLRDRRAPRTESRS